MGVPFGSKAYHQLPLLGVVPLLNQLPTLRLGQICPTACGFGILAGAVGGVCMCMCDVSMGRTMGGSVLAPLARYTPEGHSQQALNK